MADLRDPKTGCAWNREQTFQSLIAYTLEEAYEVAEAQESAFDDPDKLMDELGDLLLQIVFQSQIAKENGLFAFSDVVNAIADKMVRRHTHVFGDETAATADEVNRQWENTKAAERANSGHDSILDDVARALPALTRADKISRRTVRVGFDWPNIDRVYAKLREEIDEFEAEVEKNDQAAMHDEFGDILFTLVNIARWHKVDPEAALRDANRKFERRFRNVEANADTPLSSLNADEWHALWLKAKNET